MGKPSLLDLEPVLRDQRIGLQLLAEAIGRLADDLIPLKKTGMKARDVEIATSVLEKHVWLVSKLAEEADQAELIWSRVYEAEREMEGGDLEKSTLH